MFRAGAASSRCFGDIRDQFSPDAALATVRVGAGIAEEVRRSGSPDRPDRRRSPPGNGRPFVEDSADRRRALRRQSRGAWGALGATATIRAPRSTCERTGSRHLRTGPAFLTGRSPKDANRRQQDPGRSLSSPAGDRRHPRWTDPVRRSIPMWSTEAGRVTSTRRMRSPTRSRRTGWTPRSPATTSPSTTSRGSTATSYTSRRSRASPRRTRSSSFDFGLGQLLDYQNVLAGNGREVRAVLAVEREPSDPRWATLCERHGVRLAWPETFLSLF